MHQKFKNARKVFGESHLKQLLRSLPPHKRSTAMKHIIAEADIRVADPVGGSYGLVRNLELKIAEEEEELRRLRNVLSVFRGGGSGSVVAQPLVQKQGYIVQEHDNINYQGYHIPVLPIVPGGFLHALLHQEQRNNMFDLRVSGMKLCRNMMSTQIRVRRSESSDIRGRRSQFISLANGET